MSSENQTIVDRINAVDKKASDYEKTLAQYTLGSNTNDDTDQDISKKIERSEKHWGITPLDNANNAQRVDAIAKTAMSVLGKLQKWG